MPGSGGLRFCPPKHAAARPNAALPNAPAGAFIGRIDGSVPFGIGNQRTIEVPASGRLYLGINDDYFADNAGEFRVLIDVR